MLVLETNLIVTSLNEIWLDEEGILRVRAFKEGEFDIEEATQCFDIYKKLGCEKKRVLQLVDLSIPVLITKEAREYTDKMAPHFFIASAVVSRSLPVRIIINFCMKFFNPQVPLRMFDTELEALAWLRKHKK